MKKRILGILTALCAMLVLMPTAFAEDGKNYVSKVAVNDTWITDGNYYVSDGSGGITQVSAAPQSGYMTYDKKTGVLTMNNMTIEVSGNRHGLRLDDSEVSALVPGSTVYADLTVKLVGTNRFSVTGTGRGFELDNAHTRFAGSGSLVLTADADSAIHARSLTVDAPVTLELTTNGKDQVRAIDTVEDILLTDGKITAKALNQSVTQNPTAMLSVYGDITIGGKAEVTANGVANALGCARGTLRVSGGSLDASSIAYDLAYAKDIVFSGGKVTAKQAGGAAFAAAESLTVSDTADVTIDVEGVNLYAGTGNVSVKGGKLNLTSEKSNCIYTDETNKGKLVFTNGSMTATSKTGTAIYVNAFEMSGNAEARVSAPGSTAIYSVGDMSIKGGKLTSDAKYCGIWGNGKIDFGGGTVTAVSKEDCGIYSPKDITITGGTVAAGHQSKAYYSLRTNGNFDINGDAVFYCGTVYCKSSVRTAGVVYENTGVSIDDKGKTVLEGGYGTVFGNPNVPGFTQPPDSVFGTALDDFVKIECPSVEYTGKTAKPQPIVTVDKIVLKKTLVKDVDYTVSCTAVNVDDVSSGYIEGLVSAGSIWQKYFDFQITRKPLTWDVSDLTIRKDEDGTTSPATVSGTLKFAGICAGDTLQLFYDALVAEEFEDAKPGTYTVWVTPTNARVDGDAVNNYSFPYTPLEVSAQIDAAHKDADHDHLCDYCGETVSAHKGGSATCAKKAVCTVCGEAYGTVDANAHSLKRMKRKAPTTAAAGNIEYWFCKDCAKYFSDAQGAHEIAYADTVLAQLEQDDAPQMGDEADVTLWLMLCLLGGALASVLGLRLKNRK